MKRPMALTLALLMGLSLSMAGCSSKEETKLKEDVASLQTRVKELESQNKGLEDKNQSTALKAAEERAQLQETLAANELRLMHTPLSQFQVQPSAPLENGWLIIDGEHTYILAGHERATKVNFYWAPAASDSKPQLLGEDTVGKDGWSWKGVLPFGNHKALWAEVHYPGGVKVNSSVLPVRQGGK